MDRHALAYVHTAIALFLATVATGGCAVESPSSELRLVSQRWASTGTSYAETDSLTACRLKSGVVRVFATAKDGDRIDIFDGSTGKFVGHHGKSGARVGEFRYPNGIVAVELGSRSPTAHDAQRTPLILVIERDNHRVQAFHPDTLQPAGIFGEDVLTRPYGGAVSYRGDGAFLYVTDTDVPPEETVRVFRLRRDNQGQIQAQLVRTFGDKDGPGVVHEAESIVVDDKYERILLCDEHANERNVKVYTRDGEFTGRTFGGEHVTREPEGIAIVDTPTGGYIILTDQQKELTVWHLFDRKTYRHLAAFTGQPRVANTDGICVYQAPLRGFPAGAMFAVHDDADVRAYSLAEITMLCASQ